MVGDGDLLGIMIPGIIIGTVLVIIPGIALGILLLGASTGVGAGEAGAGM